MPLAWTLRVTISPWNSLPAFLKEPMVAMSLLLGCSSPRPSRPRWRSEGRRPTPHPLGLERSGGWRWRDFLGPREEWVQPGSPRLRGGKPRGRKSRRRHCGKAIEALPSCGPITPSRGRAGRRARQPCKEKTWQAWGRARGQALRAKEQKHSRTERRSQSSGTRASARLQTPGPSAAVSVPLFEALWGARCHGQTS